MGLRWRRCFKTPGKDRERGKMTDKFKKVHQMEIADIIAAQAKVESKLKYIAMQCAHLYAATGERGVLTLAAVAEQQRDYLRLQCVPWFEFDGVDSET